MSKRKILVAVASWYPLAMVASCWNALHGAGDSKTAKTFTFHPPRKSIEFESLPEKEQKGREKTIKEVLNAYKGKPTQDLRKVYMREAVLADPTLILDGRNSIISHFFGAAQVARECQVCYC